MALSCFSVPACPTLLQGPGVRLVLILPSSLLQQWLLWLDQQLLLFTSPTDLVQECSLAAVSQRATVLELFTWPSPC